MVVTTSICCFYLRKLEYKDCDESKFPEFICLVNILETMCFNSVNHYVVAFVSGNNVRFLLVKESGYLAKYYDKVDFEIGLARWPNFSFYSLQEIERNFYLEAGLVFDPTASMSRDDKKPMQIYCEIVRSGNFFFIFDQIINLILPR